MRTRKKKKNEVETEELGDIGISSWDMRNEGSSKPKKVTSEALSSLLSGSKSAVVLVFPRVTCCACKKIVLLTCRRHRRIHESHTLGRKNVLGYYQRKHYERKIEIKLNYYNKRLNTFDLLVDGTNWRRGR